MSTPKLFGGRRSSVFDPFRNPSKTSLRSVGGDGVLQINGQRSVEKEDKNDTWHSVERSSRSFTRRFRLPENALMDEVKATMENEVLKITVPKTQVK
ncbi:putative small heat shock protein HSP20 [Helianthus anomalus]